MRALMAVASALALATPAVAGTLQEVTTRGVILTAGGMSVAVAYTPDGSLRLL